MTIKDDIVLWDNGKDRLSLLSVPIEQQYKYIDGIPCITFAISYENKNYKGCDVFTLFDQFYIDTVSAIENAYHSLNGTFRIDDVGTDTDGYVNFTMSNSRLLIKGQLGASFSSHSLIFEFEADQTLAGILLQMLSI
ncbi:MAG: hypothetical protein IJB19_00760 [Clostridia bacterium]|nr:hypothetical protein [Clostridia bacterium]